MKVNSAPRAVSNAGNLIEFNAMPCVSQATRHESEDSLIAWLHSFPIGLLQERKSGFLKAAVGETLGCTTKLGIDWSKGVWRPMPEQASDNLVATTTMMKGSNLHGISPYLSAEKKSEAT